MSNYENPKISMDKGDRINVLTFCDYYLPGYKAGGPIKTLANMAESLGPNINFKIVTRDRDFGEDSPYKGISCNSWNKVENAQVLYISPKNLTIKNIAKITRETEHDIIYLNSFFSTKATTYPLLARAMGLSPKRPIVLATRGEFSPKALRLKQIKKTTYIFLTKYLGLYRNIIWQASSQLEKSEIEKALKSTARRISIAPDMLSKQSLSTSKRSDNEGPFKIIFLSRISKKKNLSYLLKVLESISADVTVNIFGPKEDPTYWDICYKKIQNLPQNIKVNYKGNVLPSKVHSIFEEHDLFVFPTMGENFGHVIFEALHAGTPVITSDQVPWEEDKSKAIQRIPLSQIEEYIASINEWTQCTKDELLKRRRSATKYALEYQSKGDDRNQNLALFIEANAKWNKQLKKSC